MADKDDEIERLRKNLFPYADATEISGLSWNGMYAIGDKKTIAAITEALHYASQIDEYRKAFDERRAAIEVDIKNLEERIHYAEGTASANIARVNEYIAALATCREVKDGYYEAMAMWRKRAEAAEQELSAIHQTDQWKSR